MHKFLYALMVVAVAFPALSAYGLEWKTISESEAKLRFNGIQNARTSFSSAWHDSWCCKFEISSWLPRQGKTPRAEFVHFELVSKLKYMRRQFKLKESIKQFSYLQGSDISFYDVNVVWGDRLQTGKFRYAGLECVGVVHHYGETFNGPEAPPGAGNSAYYGYYCDDREPSVEEVLMSIEIVQ